MNVPPRILLITGFAGCAALAFAAGAWWQKASSTPASSAKSAVVRTQMVAAGLAGGGAMGVGGNGIGSSEAGRAGGLSGLKAVRDMTPEQVGVRLDEILSLDDPVDRMQAFVEFAKNLGGNEQLEAAMTAIGKDFNPREKGREMSMLMTLWAQKDPEAALAHAQKMGDWRGGWAASTAIATWAKTDPDKAVAWAQAHPPENKDEGNYYMAAAIGSIAKTDLASAARLAQSMDRSEARGRAMDTLLDQYTKQGGIESARDFVSGLEDSTFKAGIMSRLAGRMAEKDPKSAAAWAASLPDTEAKPRVMTELIDRWANNDPNEAGAWLNNFPKSAQTDEPRERFAWKVAERDPEAAIAWAGTITDEKRRTETMYRLARDWSRREPDVVKGWLNTGGASLPPDMRQRLIERLSTPRS